MALLLETLLVALDKKRPRPRRASLPNPYLEGNFAPLGAEHDAPSLDVIQVPSRATSAAPTTG